MTGLIGKTAAEDHARIAAGYVISAMIDRVDATGAWSTLVMWAGKAGLDPHEVAKSVLARYYNELLTQLEGYAKAKPQ